MRFLPGRTARLACLTLALAPGCPVAGVGQEAENPPLRAVGWLGYGKGPNAGKANCTGVLIAPDLVVTADHCLIDPKTGKPGRPQSVTFMAGLSGTDTAAVRRGSEIRIEPTDALQDGSPIFGPTLGFLLLDRPIAPDEAAPLPLARSGPSPGMAVLTVGYPRSAQDQPVVQDGCRVTLHSPPVFGLSCDAVSGFSGGAVLARVKGIWLLEAIMVAEARHAADYRAIARGLPLSLLQSAQP